MNDLTGKTILLTGASRGIGAATARALGESGAHLVAHYGAYREGVDEAVSAIPDDRKLIVQADLSVPGSARRLWREAVDWRGRIDVLVVNAAVMPDTALEGSDEDWDAGWRDVLQVNVVEPASLMREAVRHYLAEGGGTVITLSSWAAQRGSAIAHLSGYAASKAAIKALAQTIARNYGRDGVLSYIVAPGIVRTRMSEISAVARGGIEAVHAMLELGEMVPPEEVADLIAYLATGRCRHLTGSTIDVNGATYVR